MNVLPLTSSAYTRVKMTAFGIGVTTAALAAMAGLQFFFARKILIRRFEVDSDIDTWAVPSFRNDILSFYAVTAAFLIAYWLLTALLGRERFLKIRSANVTLAASGIAFTFAMLVASIVREPERFLEGACSFFNLSDGARPLGFDTQTPCDAFTSTATPLLLLGLPAVLLATSAVQRILVSRD